MYVQRRRIEGFSLSRSTIPRLKVATFECQCGCGETFTTLYRTNRPLYKNKTHKQRAYRARRKLRQE